MMGAKINQSFISLKGLIQFQMIIVSCIYRINAEQWKFCLKWAETPLKSPILKVSLLLEKGHLSNSQLYSIKAEAQIRELCPEEMKVNKNPNSGTAETIKCGWTLIIRKPLKRQVCRTRESCVLADEFHHLQLPRVHCILIKLDNGPYVGLISERWDFVHDSRAVANKINHFNVFAFIVRGP